MDEFYIGDRVVFIGDPGGSRVLKGECGTVVAYGNGGPCSIGVYWDQYLEGRHTCGSRIPEGHGWFCFAGDLMRDRAYARTCKVLGIGGVVKNRKGTRRSCS